MKKHVQYGYGMLKDIKFLKEAAKIVYHHHEKWDGTGYPNNLKGEDIAIGARIFAVADTYDAMTSDRPYRKALLYEDARQEIIRCSGTQFDPNVVDVFLKIPKENLFKIRDIVDACIKSGQKPSVTMPFLNIPEIFSRL